MVPHLCGDILVALWEQKSGALRLKVACAAGFEEVREHPHLYMTSTGLEEAPEKSSLSLAAMGAVEKRSLPEQCCSPQPRHQAYLLPCPVSQGCLLGFYFQLCTAELLTAAVTPRSVLVARPTKLWMSSCEAPNPSAS